MTVALVLFFLLPDKIFVQLIDSGKTPETSTVLFLAVGALIIVGSGAMSLFNENGKKWIALQSVVAIGFVGCLVYNLFVL